MNCPNCGNEWFTYCSILEEYHCDQCGHYWEHDKERSRYICDNCAARLSEDGIEDHGCSPRYLIEVNNDG